MDWFLMNLSPESRREMYLEEIPKMPLRFIAMWEDWPHDPISVMRRKLVLSDFRRKFGWWIETALDEELELGAREAYAHFQAHRRLRQRDPAAAKEADDARRFLRGLMTMTAVEAERWMDRERSKGRSLSDLVRETREKARGAYSGP